MTTATTDPATARQIWESLDEEQRRALTMAAFGLPILPTPHTYRLMNRGLVRWDAASDGFEAMPFDLQVATDLGRAVAAAGREGV